MLPLVGDRIVSKRPRVQLAGSNALVTGAGAGIGRATALALGARGATVLVTDVDADGAERTAKEIVAAGGSATARQLDVTDADAVVALAAEHPVDIVVANAGVGMSGRLTDMTLDDWRWIRAVNLDGVVHTVHAFGPPMLARGRGHAVIVSSGLGYTMTATEPAYVTTKAAVLALAQCLRADWSKDGVGVSAICPGVINTGIVDATRFVGVDQAAKQKAQRIFRRGHQPEQVAAAIVGAIDADRAVVPVGWEARLGWWAHRITPIRMQQGLARQSLR
jgi:NAD(P)-dependent dehydrogenase (short-subunit alcohol dehydrogenase family)